MLRRDRGRNFLQNLTIIVQLAGIAPQFSWQRRRVLEGVERLF
jgi:hypothetical protein